jgi:mono/diheme cytochrome c family protein
VSSFKPTAGLLAVALTLILAAARAEGGIADAKAMKNPVKATPESIDAGKAVYTKYCRFCHNADAKGNGPLAPKGTHPPDLTDDKWDHGGSDGEIFASIHDGIGPKFDMKPLKDKITDTDIWNVVNYLRTLGPKK